MTLPEVTAAAARGQDADHDTAHAVPSRDAF
jgi:hypothetical protein